MTLKKCLQQLLSDVELSDITLKSNDNILIKANRCILGCRSLVFRQMFYGGFKESTSNNNNREENKNNIINVGFNGIILKAIIEYCYTDDIMKFRQEFLFEAQKAKILSDEDARVLVQLILAADYFELNELMKLVYKLSIKCMRNTPSLACSFFDETESLYYNYLSEDDNDYNVDEGSSNNNYDNDNDDDNDDDNQRIINKLYMSSLQLIRSKGLQCLLSPLSISSSTSSISNMDNNGVHALTVQSLQKILSDEELCIDEFGLYRTLNTWYTIPISTDSTCEASKSRYANAKSLTNFIKFENIKPSLLVNTISLSKLVSVDKINNAFKKQALQAEYNNQFQCAGVSYPTVRNRTRIHVNGAGISEVNGVYSPIGESDGIFKFEKLGIWENQETVFTLLRCERSKYWFISIIAEYDRDTTIHCIDFYKCQSSGHEFELLPPVSVVSTDNSSSCSSALWTCTRDGVYPPPYTSIVQNGQQQHNNYNAMNINHRPQSYHSQQHYNDDHPSMLASINNNSHIIANTSNNTSLLSNTMDDLMNNNNGPNNNIDFVHDEEEIADVENSYDDIVALLDTTNERPEL